MAPSKSQKSKRPPPASAKQRGGGKLDGYELTAAEQAAVERFQKRARDSSTAPRVKVEQTKDGARLSVSHANQDVRHLLLAEALGSVDIDFVNGLLRQLASAARRNGKLEEQDLNFLISVIKDIRPRDQMEAMLAAQMAVVHESIMTFARRLAHVDTIQQQDSAVSAFTKLTRTFTAQLEALKRYRSGGEQKVTVQHVTVSDGGQAIVGNVTTPTGAAPGNAKAAPLALTPSGEAPLPVLDVTQAAPVPLQRTRRKGRNGRKSPA
jgi:hypothetical protein